MDCSFCGKKTNKSIGHINRAKKIGLKIYCNRKCFGLSKRKNKSIDQKKREKAEYDKKYREKNKELLKQKKAEYFKKHYAENPESYRERRKKKYKKHLEYLSTEKYKLWKKEYDKNHRAKIKYGDYWECSILLNEIGSIVPSKKTKYDLGLINKSTKRKEAYERFKRKEFKRSALENIK